MKNGDTKISVKENKKKSFPSIRQGQNLNCGYTFLMLRNRIELVQSTGHSSVTRSLQFQVLRAAQADGFLFHLLPQLTKKKCLSSFSLRLSSLRSVV